MAISATNAAGLPVAGRRVSRGPGPATSAATPTPPAAPKFADLPAGNYTDRGGRPGSGRQRTAKLRRKSHRPGRDRQRHPDRDSGSTGPARPRHLQIPGRQHDRTSKPRTEFDRGLQLRHESRRKFTAPGAFRAPRSNATGLFPFTSPYSVYAGSCASNNPNPTSNPEAPAARRA